jgi:hypothetical protein
LPIQREAQPASARLFVSRSWSAPLMDKPHSIIEGTGESIAQIALSRGASATTTIVCRRALAPDA